MSPNGPSGGTLPLFRNRPGSRPSDEAEVIDLVRLPAGTRPTPVAYLDFHEIQACRVLTCEHYQTCLNFAAEVRWRSFHCKQCPKHPDRRAAGAAEGTEAPVIRLR
ncbi:MAG TPA: hypothetical protein RMG48_16870 [Myxococcales bacterium LLY-WYZ-16_1]|nr:hypothetical protein [Myxococcales bacterium LLY-WYZ-16_1]